MNQTRVSTSGDSSSSEKNSRRTDGDGQHLQFEHNAVVDRQVARGARAVLEEATLARNVPKNGGVTIVRGRVVHLEGEMNRVAAKVSLRSASAEAGGGARAHFEFFSMRTSSRLPPPKDVLGFKG